MAFLSESEPTLSIDDSIDKYLPELLGTFSGRITLRQLATHTSGLPRLPCTDPKTSYCFHPREWRNPYSDYSEAALLDYLKQFNRKDVGPYQEDYSNTGFAVLGLVVTRIKSTKFDSLLSEIITGPLGMNQTRVLRPGLMVSNFLKPYDIDRAEVLHWEWAVFAPAGGIISSSRDMIKFLKANVNPPDSALGRAIQKSQKLGLGWDSAPGAAVVFKNGMTAGFKAMVLIDHRVNAGVYVLSNMGSSYGDSVAWSVLGDKIQDLVGLELSKDELARYKGEYKSDYGPEKGEGNGSDLLTVAGSGKFLILEFQDKKLRLNPKAFHEFNGFDGVHQNGYHKVSFQQDDSGRVYQTVLHLQVEKGKFVDLTFQRVSPY